MKIDWFTVIAQIINFLVLMWLLKRLLYKPILAAIDERETNIKNQLLDAESQKIAAMQEREKYKLMNEAFNKEKDALMQQTVIEAKIKRDKLIEKARNEANELKDGLEKAFAEDQARKNNNIAKRIGSEVFVMAQKALKDVSSASLEAQTVKVFLSKLKGLQDHEKVKFIDALKEDKPILVHSAFSLSDNQRTSIQNEINSLSKTDNTYVFKTRPELISGIEILTGGYRLSWNISDYLASMDANVDAGKNLEL